MGLILNTFFILYLFNFFERGEVAVGNNFHIQKAYHEPRSLVNDDVTEIARLSDMTRFKQILSHILVPRVVGTESHTAVREYIVNEMRGLGWSVEIEESNQKTPLGPLTFRNVIARLNPDADRYLVLSCHYDSKHMRENTFLGATDSAVPCAMMIDLAHALSSKLEPFKSKELSLMLLFFDGEEAFVSWGPTDSIYGARSLAAKWEKTKYPEDSSDTCHLDRMDLLVLLDLLGTPSPRFYSYFKKTNKWYRQMVSAEKRLTSLQLLEKHPDDTYFYKMQLNAHIEDDHIPFIRRDVRVLHLIPTPFPDVWHNYGDNYSALDMKTINNLNKIIRVFTMEYLGGGPRVTRSTDPVYEDL